MRALRLSPARLLVATRRRMRWWWQRQTVSLRQHIPDDRLAALVGMPGASREDLLKRFASPRRAPFPGLNGRDDGLAALIREDYAEEAQACIARADEICGGSLKLLGYEFMRADGKVDWHLDPASGEHMPRKHWTQTRFSPLKQGAKMADFLLPSEPNKHEWFVALGRAFALTGDEKYAIAFTTRLQEWLRECPVEKGAPYFLTTTVAQRLVSWLFCYFLFQGSAYFRRHGLHPFISSLYLQSKFLYENRTVYWVPRNNHVIAESTALLLVAATFPEFREAPKWLAEAKRSLSEEVERQVWPDGVSVEQSTGYHLFVLDCLLLAYLALRTSDSLLAARLEGHVERMIESLAWLARPDGTIPHIGDVSTERVCHLSDAHDILFAGAHPALGAVLFNRGDLKAVAGRFHEEAVWLLGPEGKQAFDRLEPSGPGLASRAFRDGGYYVMRSDWSDRAHHMVIDCGYTGLGKNGPGGHGHNDTLGFDLSIYGQPAVIDVGTYTYYQDRSWRDAFRSTRAHNTVVVDGKEMADLGPGLFEIRNQPVPQLHAWKSTSQYDLFDGAHSGYERLDAPVRHRRQVLFVKPDYWIVRDLLQSTGPHAYDLYLHLAPSEVEVVPPALAARFPSGAALLMLLLEPQGAAISVEAGWVSLRYGTKTTAPVVRYHVEGAGPVTLTTVLFPVPVSGTRESLDAHQLIHRAQKDMTRFLDGRLSVRDVSVQTNRDLVNLVAGPEVTSE